MAGCPRGGAHGVAQRGHGGDRVHRGEQARRGPHDHLGRPAAGLRRRRRLAARGGARRGSPGTPPRWRSLPRQPGGSPRGRACAPRWRPGVVVAHQRMLAARADRLRAPTVAAQPTPCSLSRPVGLAAAGSRPPSRGRIGVVAGRRDGAWSALVDVRGVAAAGRPRRPARRQLSRLARGGVGTQLCAACYAFAVPRVRDGRPTDAQHDARDTAAGRAGPAP